MLFPINFYSRKCIEYLQYRKLSKIVKYAYEHSEFYRNLYRINGFKPEDFKSMADINKIPIVRRRDLRNAPTEQIVTSSNLKKFHLHTTSGSSGLSVRYYFSKWEQILKNYYVLRAYLNARMGWFVKTVALRDPIDITKPNILQKLGMFRYEYYNIYTPIEEMYDGIIKNNPKKIAILKGYPSDLVNLATLASKRGDFPTVDMIYSDSEVLDSSSREYISKVFKCPILDFYASVECGMIAFQTPTSNGLYCINEDAVLLETIEQEGLSEVVISNLRNKVFPIIRYEIGDAIDFGTMEVDKYTGFKTLKQIYGKYLDFLLMPDKTIVSPHIPKQDLTHTKGVAKFKLVQTELDNVDIYIQKNEDWTSSTEKELREKLNKGFNNQVKINFIYVDSLERGDKRKFKCIESKIAQDFLSQK